MKITEHKLSDLLITLENGGRPAGGVGSIASGIPSVGGEHLTADGGFDFRKVKYVPEEYFQNMRRGHIQTDDILIVKDGATTGKISFVTKDFPFKKAAVNEHVFILRVNKDKVLSKFLFYNLFSPSGQKQILANYRGAAIGGINQSFTQNTIVPLPPLPEQERIVRLLDEVESIRATRERANLRMEQFISALFYEMFENNKQKSKWQITKLEKIISRITNGYVGPTRDIYKDKGIPYILSKHIKLGEVFFDNETFISDEFNQKNSKSTLKENDVLIVQTGQIGETAVVRENHIGHNCHALIVITPLTEFLVGDFLSEYLRSDYGRMQLLGLQTGATLKHLNCGDVKQIELSLPPLALQREFAARVEEARGVQSAQGKSAERIEALYQSMLSRAFAGEL